MELKITVDLSSFNEDSLFALYLVRSLPLNIKREDIESMSPRITYLWDDILSHVNYTYDLASFPNSWYDVWREHIPGSPNYVKERDWLYLTPELMLLIPIAVFRPMLLRCLAANTDFENVIESMILEFEGKK